LIDEAKAADVLDIGLPMYKLGMLYSLHQSRDDCLDTMIGLHASEIYLDEGSGHQGLNCPKRHRTLLRKDHHVWNVK
jgi:hypothetical protein